MEKKGARGSSLFRTLQINSFWTFWNFFIVGSIVAIKKIFSLHLFSSPIRNYCLLRVYPSWMKAMYMTLLEIWPKTIFFIKLMHGCIALKRPLFVLEMAEGKGKKWGVGLVSSSVSDKSISVFFQVSPSLVGDKKPPPPPLIKFIQGVNSSLPEVADRHVNDVTWKNIPPFWRQIFCASFDVVAGIRSQGWLPYCERIVRIVYCLLVLFHKKLSLTRKLGFLKNLQYLCMFCVKLNHSWLERT